MTSMMKVLWWLGQVTPAHLYIPHQGYLKAVGMMASTASMIRCRAESVPDNKLIFSCSLRSCPYP